jgi:hypothetical protein
MATWQQLNPGKCARCSVRLSGYDPVAPPVCADCVTASSTTELAPADTENDTDVGCGYEGCDKELDRNVGGIPLCDHHAEEYEKFMAYTSRRR